MFLRRCLPSLLALGLTTALVVEAATTRDVKSLKVVPASGPLAGKEIYSNSHALLIGINKYPNLPEEKHLNYAVADVLDLRETLIRHYGFLADNVTVLTDARATKANIEEALSHLADRRVVKPGDRLLIYFSGHGQTVKTATGGDMGFLIPYDAKVDLDDFENAGPFLRTCVRMDTVWGYLESSPAKHALLLADACYSGLLTKSRALETISPSALAAMVSRRALQVITAGRRGEQSFEIPKYGHGAFTYKLLEELKAQAETPGNLMTATELAASLKRSVSNLTDGKQSPQFGEYNAEGEFVFVTTPAQVVPTLALPSAVEPGKAETINLDTAAQLRVTSQPTGARIFVDGKDTGKKTPYTIEVELGLLRMKKVEVGLELNGYKTRLFEVELQRGKRLSPEVIGLVKVVTTTQDEPPPSGKRVNPIDGAEMVYIPAGTFQMGDNNSGGTQRVEGFYMYTKTVTNEQFRKFVQAHPEWGPGKVVSNLADSDYLVP